MNENQLICRQLRQEFSKSGWALLAYYGIMNVSVSMIAALSVMLISVRAVVDPNMAPLEFEQLLADAIMGNGWGYILAIAVGGVLMLLWKKKEFCLKTIWKPGKPMTVGSFFAILAVFMSGQTLSQALTPLLQWLFGLMGISLDEMMEAASGTTDSLSMFLYVCLFAPVAEEILFRGLILRDMERYGKKFAIFTSAFLFGIFHGNLIQTPYAFLVGLVLGYVAMEYHILWAMVLHMVNNLLLADTLGRLVGSLSVLAQQIIYAVIIWCFGIGAVVILIIKRKAVADYFRQGKMHPLCLKSFFTSPGILTLTGVLVGNILLTLLLQLI